LTWSAEPCWATGRLPASSFAQPHTLLTAHSTATLIEQRLLLELKIEEKMLVEALFEQCRRFPTDAIFAVDRRGRLVRLNAAAEQLFAAHPCSDGQTLFDELRLFLKAAFEYEGKHFEEHEQVLNSRTLGRAVRTVASLVVRNNDPISAIIVLPSAGTVRTYRNNHYATVGLGINRHPTGARYFFEDIVTVSPKMADVIALCQTVAGSDLPVLVLGESGTGKEMIAQSIHNASQRSGAPFVAVNCASIPEGLIDAEFFGYEEGAFTGARRGGSVGMFEQANRRTIFLDEVSELPPQAQAALLRVLQEKEVLRIGAGMPRRVDVRVIAATNRELSSELDGRRFRADLFYRLNGMAITLPPLRERSEDLPILASRFLDELPGRECPRLSESALEALAAYQWPGNVRELRNVVHRAAIVANGPFITVADLPAELRSEAGNRAGPDTSHSHNLERDRILAILAECNGNVAEAARRLGVSRMTMHRKIRKWSVSRLEVLNSACGFPPR
jgi:transcriptional regulator with PAS, ATPase and Fis domain